MVVSWHKIIVNYTMSQQTYYRTTPVYLGDTVTFNTGDYYEKIENGVPKLLSCSNGYGGFVRSNIKEVCASHSPAASLFGAVKGGGAGAYFIYAIQQDPDVDISSAAFDFSVLEEVRYRNPKSNPVSGTHFATVYLPDRASTDVELAYLPPGGGIIHEWATAIKSVFETMISYDTVYPDNIVTECSVQRPNREAYRDPYAFA